jgi:hypothetical protein
MSVLARATRRYIPEGGILHSHSRENLQILHIIVIIIITFYLIIISHLFPLFSKLKVGFRDHLTVCVCTCILLFTCKCLNQSLANAYHVT